MPAAQLHVGRRAPAQRAAGTAVPRADPRAQPGARATLATAQVAAQVANAIQVAECTEDVVVTTETGAIAYRLYWGSLVGAED
jgi:hypothetical protein